MQLISLLVIAAAFWGQTPACGQPSIAQAELPPPVVGLADVVGCSITVDPRRLNIPGMGCQIVLHEYGHLVGFGHSTDPDNIMYPVLRPRPAWPCAW